MGESRNPWGHVRDSESAMAEDSGGPLLMPALKSQDILVTYKQQRNLSSFFGKHH